MKRSVIILSVIVFSLIHTLLFNSVISADKPRPKIGLALSGGGAKGMAHIGVLKVLEEAGVPIDFISGTSMGGILGGLYAIGYDAKRIERIATSQDWDILLSDNIVLQNLSMEEKEEAGKYIGSFPFTNFKIELPKGLVSGHNIQMLLSRLCWPIHYVEDFNDFPIPFRCVAADIETGEAVVLKSGYLPDALRASMSIPSAFTPVELDGRLLVDGGVVHNFPVEDLIDMGADIIIGVDVGDLLFKRDELNSLVEIFSQTMNFNVVPDTKRQQKLCDILIKPDISDFDIMSFDKTEALIKQGELAARLVLDRLEALADSTKLETGGIRFIPTTDIESLYLADIKINGLQKVSPELVWGKLGIKKGIWLSPEKVERAIDRLYGSKFFERVTYKFLPVPGGTNLIIDVKEQHPSVFRLGMRYGSDLKSALLLNTTFRNLVTHGSKISLDLILGDNPSLEMSFFAYITRNPGLGISLDWNLGDMQVYRYDEDVLTGDYKYEYQEMELNVMNVNSNSFSFELGAHYHHARIQKIVGLDYPGAKDMGFFGIHGKVNVNTLDRVSFPRRGMSLYADLHTYRKQYTSSPDIDMFNDPCNLLIAGIRTVRELGSKFALDGSVNFGFADGENIHPTFYVYLGGQNSRHAKMIPFIGMDYLQLAGKSAGAIQLSARYEMWKDRYFIFKSNVGDYGNDLNDLISGGSKFYGFGLSFAVNSLIGPIEYSVMWNSRRNIQHTYFNLGYMF